MPDTALLSIEDLSVTYETETGVFTAVEGVSLQLHRGQTLAVVGESGSGKSSVAASINRVLPPNGSISGGRILFDGMDLTAIGQKAMDRVRGRRIGLVPQDPMSNLNPLMRIGDQIVEALHAQDFARGAAARAIAVELLSRVGIPDAERRFAQYPHEFSGGMRQRVLIAIGFCCEPDLIIADEPTSALDVTVQRRVLDQLGLLARARGTAVFLITHDLALAAERADTVAVMHQGRVVETGPAAALLENPQHPYTRRLVEAVPARRHRLAPGPGRPEAEAEPLVVLEGVTKEFSIRSRRMFGRPAAFRAVDEASLVVPRGKTVAIVGESGSGKSTMARLILRLDRPSGGTIRFEGRDTAGLDRRGLFAFRRKVQPVFQNPYASLDPRYTVGRTVAEPLYVHRACPPAEIRGRVAALLEQVALPAALATRFPHELSGGQRQRVAIARALALTPELIVLDEAVSALDVLVQAQILELLASLQRELTLSYLFISHDLAVVRMIADIVHVMQKGRVVESGAPEEIFEHPRHDYTRELLAAIPGARRAA